MNSSANLVYASKQVYKEPNFAVAALIFFIVLNPWANVIYTLKAKMA
jgi:hypothetical protein